MSFKRYTLIRLLVIIIIVGFINWAIAIDNFWIPIPVIIAALVVLLLFRRRGREIVVDERIYSIAEKASYVAFRIFGLAAAIIGATLVVLDRDSSSGLQPIGLTLAFAVCGLLVIYYIAYIYYNRKYSGKK